MLPGENIFFFLFSFFFYIILIFGFVGGGNFIVGTVVWQWSYQDAVVVATDVSMVR